MEEPDLAGGAKQGQPSLSFQKLRMAAACPWVLPWDPESLRGLAWRKGASAGILRAPVDRRTLKTGDPFPVLPPREL